MGVRNVGGWGCTLDLYYGTGIYVYKYVLFLKYCELYLNLVTYSNMALEVWHIFWYRYLTVQLSSYLVWGMAQRGFSQWCTS